MFDIEVVEENAGRLGGGSSSSLRVRSMTSDLRFDPAPPPLLPLLRAAATGSGKGGVLLNENGVTGVSVLTL